MKKGQSKFVARIGLLALACGVMGYRSQALARDKAKKLTDLRCTAGQFPLFDGTQWVCADAAPQPRFVDNGDGTITDNQTGLMWEKKTGTLGSAILCLDPPELSAKDQYGAGHFN